MGTINDLKSLIADSSFMHTDINGETEMRLDGGIEPIEELIGNIEDSINTLKTLIGAGLVYSHPSVNLDSLVATMIGETVKSQPTQEDVEFDLLAKRLEV